MVTNRVESLHLMGILLRYMSKKEALRMVSDMEFEIADHTENKSLRDSIVMLRKTLQL